MTIATIAALTWKKGLYSYSIVLISFSKDRSVFSWFLCIIILKHYALCILCVDNCKQAFFIAIFEFFIVYLFLFFSSSKLKYFIYLSEHRHLYENFFFVINDLGWMFVLLIYFLLLMFLDNLCSFFRKWLLLFVVLL